MIEHLIASIPMNDEIVYLTEYDKYIQGIQNKGDNKEYIGIFIPHTDDYPSSYTRYIENSIIKVMSVDCFKLKLKEGDEQCNLQLYLTDYSVVNKPYAQLLLNNLHQYITPEHIIDIYKKSYVKTIQKLDLDNIIVFELLYQLLQFHGDMYDSFHKVQNSLFYQIEQVIDFKVEVKKYILFLENEKIGRITLPITTYLELLEPYHNKFIQKLNSISNREILANLVMVVQYLSQLKYRHNIQFDLATNPKFLYLYYELLKGNIAEGYKELVGQILNEITRSDMYGNV